MWSLKRKMVSRCCESKIFVQCSNESTCYYVCTKCHRATDPKEEINDKVE